MNVALESKGKLLQEQQNEIDALRLRVKDLGEHESEIYALEVRILALEGKVAKGHSTGNVKHV